MVQYCSLQEQTRRLRMSVLRRMRSKGVVKEAERASKKLDVGSSQTGLHSDDGDKALLEMFKGGTIESCSPQNSFVQGVAAPFMPSPSLLGLPPSPVAPKRSP